MKKSITLWSVAVAMAVSVVSADGLKNSLTNIMHEKEQSSVVDLGEINLNGKPKPVKRVRKSRSRKAVVATVNGIKLIKKDADTYLGKRTQGKVKDLDLLPRKQQKRLIEEMALPMLITDSASKELTEQEKESVFSSMWMKKQGATVAVSDAQIMEFYNQLKKESMDCNVTTPIPEFGLIKERLRRQIIERTIVKDLMDNAKIEVSK